MYGQTVRRELYPPIQSFDSGRLRVDPIHELYYERFGNPKGKPALFLHGGPGGGCTATQARFWDPEHYQILLFDQRGCGKSTPHASLENNTTWDLVSDIEKLRKHLGIQRFQVFGGSWGSTLALAYAQTHPEAVSELVLRGIFLLRKKEIDWFYQDGANHFFPAAWENFVAPIPPEERHDLLHAYHRRLVGKDPEEQLRAAKAWAIWEGSTSTLRPNQELARSMGRDHFALAFARIESHYFVNRGFFEREEQLLEGIDRIRHIPTVIVQGRYDVVCPPSTAWELHRAWPQADVHITGTSGHSAFEGETLHCLVQATDRFRD